MQIEVFVKNLKIYLADDCVYIRDHIQDFYVTSWFAKFTSFLYWSEGCHLQGTILSRVLVTCRLGFDSWIDLLDTHKS
jgi:hypothetical protein